MSTIRKAARADLDAVCRIYDQIHTAEERGEAAIGWQRGVYPERETARHLPQAAGRTNSCPTPKWQRPTR